jgi:hypothetical protein
VLVLALTAIFARLLLGEQRAPACPAPQISCKKEFLVPILENIEKTNEP